MLQSSDEIKNVLHPHKLIPFSKYVGYLLNDTFYMVHKIMIGLKAKQMNLQEILGFT